MTRSDGHRVLLLAGSDLCRDPQVAAHAAAAAAAGRPVTIVGPMAGGPHSAEVDGFSLRRLVVPPPTPPAPPHGFLPRRWSERARSLRHRLTLGPARRRAQRVRRWAELLAPVLAEQQGALIVPLGDELTRAATAAGASVLSAAALDGPGGAPPPALAALAGTVLGIGPANMAGQGWAWTRAVRRELPGVEVEAFAVPHQALAFPSDVALPADAFARDARWQTELEMHLQAELTHLLIEAGRPVVGPLNGRTFVADARRMRAAGVIVGLVFHGSEIRDPRRHAERYPWSPFRDPANPLTARLQRQVDALAPLVAAFDGPTYVSTPDLLDDVPGATWLPVVVDLDVWTPGDEPLRRDRPLVVHAPSHRALKGTELVEPILARLHDAGRLTYRRIEGVPTAEVPALVRDADVVLDHFGIGNYGVLTCEAMATGRVSISHIHERVRARLPVAIPTLEATPDTLEAVLTRVLDDRDWARSFAADGPAFARDWHDGRRSAGVLASFVGH
jgi:hypothetical protein